MGESDDYMSCYDAGSDIVWMFTRQQVASVAVTTNGESRVRLVGTDSDIMMDRRQTQALLGWITGPTRMPSCPRTGTRSRDTRRSWRTANDGKSA